MSQKKTVAVSFAWKEENEGPNKELVKAFCDECEKKGIAVTKDSLWLKHGDDLSKFMREQVGKAGVLVLFLSEAYIKSHNCMYEYLVAWNYDFGNPDALASRMVLVSLLRPDLWDEKSHWGWATEHWQKLADEQSALRQEYVGTLCAQGTKLVQHIKEIALKVSDMLTFTNGRLALCTPVEPSQIVKEVQLRLGIDPESAETAEVVFAAVVDEINEVLALNEYSRELLKSVAPNLITDGRLADNVVSLLNEVADNGSFLVRVFRKLRDAIRQRNGVAAGDAEELKKVVGGLLILTLSHDWINKWHRAWLTGNVVKLPGRDLRFSLGKGVDGVERQVNMLALFCSGLSRACAKLDELFATEQRYSRKLEPLPHVSEGIAGDALADEIQLSLIRQVAPDKWKHDIAPSKEKTQEREQFEEVFLEIVELLKFAKDEERSPWVAADTTWATRREIVFDQLSVRELLLIDGNDGKLKDVLPELQNKLLSLREIWQILSPK